MADDPTYDNVLVDIDGPVATITLNRPEQLNAMSRGLLNDLYQALRDLNPGDDVRVIRLRGAGRAFCPGYDLGPTTGAYAGGGSKRKKDGPGIADYGESSIAIDRESLREMIDRWLWMWNFRKPVIAQVHGYCLSGGLDLIGACDIVWAAEGTLFGHPAARGMGIPVTVGLLPLKMGAAATKELLFTGDLLDAEEARELGLIRRVLPADELDGRVAEFCQRIALNPLDVLTVHKHVTNRTAEIMGSRLAAFEGAEYDAIAHMTPSMAEFGRRVNTDGLRAALAWRDGPTPPARRPTTTPRCDESTDDPHPAPAARLRPPRRGDDDARQRRRAGGRRRDRAVRSTSSCSSATSSTTTGCPPRPARSWPTSSPASTCPWWCSRATTTASCRTRSGDASRCRTTSR